MAKFEEPFESTQTLYNQAILNADLARFVNITILTNNRAKEIFKVIKANDILSHIASTDIVIVISKPDVVTFSGVLSKHTFATWNVLRESIKTLYQAEKQAEDERKAATEKAKADKFVKK